MNSRASSISHVIRVRFREPVDGRTDYFFGSLRAIYTRFSPADVGAPYWFLMNRARITRGHATFENEKCTISREEVVRVRNNKSKQ